MADDVVKSLRNPLQKAFGVPETDPQSLSRLSGASARKFKTDFTPEQWEQYKATLPPVLQSGMAEQHLKQQGIPSEFLQQQAGIGSQPSRDIASLGGSPEEEQQRQAKIQALNKIRGQ